MRPVEGTMLTVADVVAVASGREGVEVGADLAAAVCAGFAPRRVERALPDAWNLILGDEVMVGFIFASVAWGLIGMLVGLVVSFLIGWFLLLGKRRPEIIFVALGTLPALDEKGRPMFAYGRVIHDDCPRRGHFDAGRFVQKFGDEAHRAGYCLYKMGCKGPVSFQNCPNVRWNSGTNWPIGCGHPCIGCAEPDFWDKMTPFYTHLAGVPGFNVHSKIDTVGIVATVGVGAAFAAHQEGVVGTLLPGHAADFILVRDDYFAVPETDIWKNEVIGTWVAGQRVYPE